MNKMDPLAICKVGARQEWRSTVNQNGAKNPEWKFQHMDIPVKKLNKLNKTVHIEVRDAKRMNQPLGHANVTLGVFASRGPIEEKITLMEAGRPVGHIFCRS